MNMGSDAAPRPDLPFTRLGRYEVRAKIGEGGMATLYVGRGPENDVVALKVIRREYARDMQFVAMFLDEGKLTARLNHPNIVKVYEQANDGGNLFIAMELLFGQSLLNVWETLQRKKRKLPYELLAWIGARVADALHHAHELCDERGVRLQVVHRDINPSNVFITYGGQVKVIDFGLAKAVDRLTSTVAGIVKGKLAYMSPEQISGAGLDHRADIFSLGTTMWEISCDRRLFKRDNDAETMLKVQAAEVPDPVQLVPGYPPALARIVMRALAKDPAARYATGAELARELDAYVSAGGRIVTPGTLLELMAELFPEERDRDASWYEGAAPPISTVPLAPLRLSSDALQTAYGDLEAVKLEDVAPKAPAAAPGEGAEAAVKGGEESSVIGAKGEIPGLPKGTFALLTTGELALMGALVTLVIVAIVVAVISLK